MQKNLSSNHAVSNKKALFTLFLVIFIDLVGFGIVIPILPYYAKTYGASALTLGLLMTSYSFFQFLFSPFWGKLSDTHGRRPVLLFSIAASILSMSILGLSEQLNPFFGGLFWLFLGRSFSGIANANISTAAAAVTDLTDEHNRAKGMGMIGAAFGLGFIFGPAIGGLLSHFGPHAPNYSLPMFAAALLSLINFIFAYFSLPETNSEIGKIKERPSIKERFQILNSNPHLKISSILYFLTTLAMTQMEVAFALFFLERFSLTANKAGLLLASMGLIMVFIQGGLISRLSKYFGPKALVLAGTIAMTFGLALVGQSKVFSLSVIALIFLGIGQAIVNPSLSSLVSFGSNTTNRGLFMGVYQSASSLARILGPLFAGIFYDQISIASPFFLGAILCMIGFFIMHYWRNPIENPSPFSQWIAQGKELLQTQGFKALLKKYGWKLVVVFFLYYLIRDLTLYVALPILAARGFF